jgi:metal-responsive CopG/Arc/MetJ family transcriptional regulator
MVSSNTVIINVAIPKGFLSRLDQAAKVAYLSRSEYIRRAIAEKLEVPRPPANNWVIVEALPESVSDEELLKIVKIVKNHHKT